MKRGVFGLVAVLVCALAGSAGADIAVVVEHVWTGGGNISAFDYSPNQTPQRFCVAGYGSAADLRWSNVLDDTTEPWQMEGGLVLSSFQWELFARNGFPANIATFGVWGMNYCPLDDSYMLNCLSVLKGYNTGSLRLEEERDIAKYFPGLPNSPTVMPTNCSVSNAGGIYTLTDGNLTFADGFLASGVQVGHRVTVFAVDIFADVAADTYTVLEVLSDNQLRLDKDPIYSGGPVLDGIGYILAVQPHVTIKTFRQNMPYYANNLYTSPKANKKGGLSLDGTTLYIPEIVTGTVLAVDTLVPEQFSVYVSTAGFEAYVQAQVAAGRHKGIINPYFVYTDSIDFDWNNASVSTTVSTSSTDEVAVGSRSLKATFTAAGSKLVFQSDSGSAQDPADFSAISFWIHGGTGGGQSIDLWLANSNGVGSSVSLAPLAAGAWSQVVIPINQFSVLDDVFTVEFRNTSGAAQAAFYLDQLVFDWADPLPDWVGAFDPLEGQVASGADAFVDNQGRLWLVETETGDIVWTTDGQTLNTFLKSNDFQAVAQNESSSQFSNGLTVNGLVVDNMGTVYWTDNFTRSIWRAPAINPADHIMPLAMKDDILAAIGVSPRGLSNFTIRGSELLTFNFVDGNFIYKVDLDTFDFGDLDGDFDVDLGDYAYFQRCMDQDATTNGCERCDLDRDVDVDMDDFMQFEPFLSTAQD